ncbi:transcriptional regulator BetI [Thalassotalea marina]|uniref:HTH-type transcriptional regulator BetI n=1 Tax=Thalassotalea marina TaxID=1673741 RepID=A0A919BIE5_9GAMM|nr:transcriptional regulator BetI [Thalassotalea marina]GHF91055.1 HTH-type transcriptional regulator BetI [Thalassotalea marina]
MPKVGMEKIRKQQLIEATLASIEEHGLQGTTIVSIAKLAGVSTGIISHYFGGKTGLLKETTLYLLAQLKIDFLAQFKDKKPSANQRISYIINANFTSTQSSNKAAVAWLSFWVQSMHSDEFRKLQKLNHARLASNLKFSLKQLIKYEHLDMVTQILAAQIDGQWLRCALAHSSEEKFKQAGIYCQQLADDLIERYKY